MLKIFLALVKKEVFHILRDRRTLVILFGMPIALVLIFGYTVTNEFRGAGIAVVNQAHDPLSQEFIAHLQSSGHLELRELPGDVNDLDEAFRQSRVKLGVVIPPEFERRFYRDRMVTVQLIADASEPNNAATLTSYASQMVAAFQAQKGGVVQGPYQIDIETRMLYNPKLIGAYNFIPGVAALILMLISAMMTSLTLAKEKETGTMDVLLASPLPPLLIILGKVTPYAVLSFIDAMLVFAMGYFIFEVPILGSLPLLLLLCLLYLLVSLSLGILISTKSATQQAAMMVSLFTLLMPTMLLSGFMFPIASMPDMLQVMSSIIPANYFIQIEQGIMLKGAGWNAIGKPTYVLLGMLVLLLGLAWRNFKVVKQ